MRIENRFFLPCLILCGLPGFLSGALTGHAAIRNQIVQAITAGSMVPIQGDVHPFARPEYDQGPVQGSFVLSRVRIVFKPAEGQQTSLENLLEQQRDPSSANYHQWLTPEQFADQFGLTQADLSKVVAWLRSQGFTNIATARSRTSVAFSGSAAQLAAAFHVQIHRYVLNNKTHYANANAPYVPSALAGVVLAFRGLNDFRPKPRSRLKRVKSSAQPRFTSSISGDHFIAPEDFATIYNVGALYANGIDGSGEKIAVMGQTDINMTDLEEFRTAAGLAPNDPTVVTIPGYVAGTNNNDLGEADLDLEWSGAVARNASIIYVNAGVGSLGAFDALTYAVDQDLAPVISISYGDCEADFGAADLRSVNALAAQANAEGITILAAAGDSGAADCDNRDPSTAPVDIATHGLAVDFPASSPYVTGIGGGEFYNDSTTGGNTYWSSTSSASGGSALSYIPEQVWNDTAADAELSAGGGGASSIFAKPAWQAGPGVPNDNARDVPDVALSASSDHDGYLVCSSSYAQKDSGVTDCVSGFRATDQTLDVVGGTSVGPPVFAGIVALINQKMGSAQGNVNPGIYALAASSAYQSAFHDITTGNNEVPCQAGTPNCANGGDIGYSAGVGYDQASGWGSINTCALASSWGAGSPVNCSPPDFQISASVASLTLSAGGTGAATVTITPINNFSGAVQLSCTVSSALTSTACSVSPGSVATAGAATVTVTAAATAAAFPSWPGQFALGHSLVLSLAAGLCFIILLTQVFWRRAAPGFRRWVRANALLVGTLVLLAALGTRCGGGGTATSASVSSNTTQTKAPETGNITVNAVSGTISHSAQISITVN